MVYNYYMKITRLFWFVLLLLISTPCLLRAQVTVVRVSGSQVYLDTSSLGRTVQKGEIFKVILSSETLTNPKTGKDLGLVYTYSPEGKITEVQPLYAVGTLPDTAAVSVGQEAVLDDLPVTQTPATAVAAQTQTTPVSSRKKITYEPVEQTIVALTEAPVLQPGAENIVTLSDKGEVTVWTRNGQALEKQISYTLPGSNAPLSVSAAPVSGGETAEVFVSYYDTREERITTQILQVQNGAFTAVQTIPYYVHETGCTPAKTVWAQRPFVTGIYPGNAHAVVYEKGKFAASGDRRSTQRNWLNAVNWAEAEKPGQNEFFYVSSGGKITALLSGGKRAESKALFASSPNRVKYKQEILKFYPPFQIFGSGAQASVAGVENTTKYGILSGTFGQYQSGKIHYMNLQKGRLQITDSVELDGVVYDTACNNRALLTAEVLPDGSSSVVEIFN